MAGGVVKLNFLSHNTDTTCSVLGRVLGSLHYWHGFFFSSLGRGLETLNFPGLLVGRGARIRGDLDGLWACSEDLGRTEEGKGRALMDNVAGTSYWNWTTLV